MSVAGGAGHPSACWLPPDAVGPGETARITRLLAAGRSGKATAA